MGSPHGATTVSGTSSMTHHGFLSAPNRLAASGAIFGERGVSVVRPNTAAKLPERSCRAGCTASTRGNRKRPLRSQAVVQLRALIFAALFSQLWPRLRRLLAPCASFPEAALRARFPPLPLRARARAPRRAPPRRKLNFTSPDFVGICARAHPALRLAPERWTAAWTPRMPRRPAPLRRR
eukprot:scaffold2405_cov211-Pinguiococcus_pyrenoidosus.AAC.2